MKGRILLTPAALLAAGLLGAAQPISAQTPVSSCKALGKGSYVLTQNLTTTGHCLTLVGNFVTVDLNGFAITGDGGTNDYGIRAGAVATLTGIEIRNGTITNFGRAISFPSASGVVVERVRALRNTAVGIWLGNGCVLKDNVATGNRFSGIVGGSCVVTGNTSNQNGIGIDLGPGATVIGNTVRDNAEVGILAQPGSTIGNNSSFSNGNYGILAACPSNVVGNTATDNGFGNILFNGAGCGNNFNVAP